MHKAEMNSVRLPVSPQKQFEVNSNTHGIDETY